jgi:hypothetical protein
MSLPLVGIEKVEACEVQQQRGASPALLPQA